MTPILFFLIYLPLTTGAVLLLVGRHGGRSASARLVLLLSFIAAVITVARPPADTAVKLLAGYQLHLGLSLPARLIIIFVSLFGFLVGVYSSASRQAMDRRAYFSCLLWLVAASNLVCLAVDFVSFIFGWGATLVLLYALLGPASGTRSANKALCIVGMGDFCLMLGIFIYVSITGTTIMPEQAGVRLDGPLSWSAFVLMLLGAFAKAGCAPMHTWIPDAEEEAMPEVMAILPASLDKLLGIYILARMCSGFFILNPLANSLLLVMGSVTIVFAVLLALIQHDLRKLLSYHAISQVGYMVLGIGTGTAVGLAGGLFHMINHAIYKSGLFLSAGAVGQRKGTFELEKLGGLAGAMPVTFAAALVFALSISGVPPLNGFASKWLVYQGALEGVLANSGVLLRLVYILGLAAAMFGSVLTLASFIKFIHAVFLGERRDDGKSLVAGSTAGMDFALVILAGLCVALGFVPTVFINFFIRPVLNGNIALLGSWNSTAAFLLLLAGMVFGAAFWRANLFKRARPDVFFIGGEEPAFGPSFPATQFYRSLEELPVLSGVLRCIKLEYLDIYNILLGASKVVSYLFFIFVDRLIDILMMLCGRSVFGLSRLARKAHTGNLDFYLLWTLLGLAAIFITLAVLKC